MSIVTLKALAATATKNSSTNWRHSHHPTTTPPAATAAKEMAALAALEAL